jgi:release factor glutamine methyltransferase
MQTPLTIVSRDESQRLRQVLSDAEQRLSLAGIDTARLDAEVLLGDVLALAREQLLARSELPLTKAQIRQYNELLRRRLMREPLAYITGRREFWSLEFDVSADVLIPRPETERLVEVALALVQELPCAEALQVLDIGTGSGAIAISLAKEIPSSVVSAIDVSSGALKVARANAARHEVTDRVHFFHGDLFEQLGGCAGRFDLIVANPPYIRSADIDGLEPEVSSWEPRRALDGGADGLDLYRRIARGAHDYMTRDGVIAMEVGATTGEEVASLFAELGTYTGLTIFPDYAGRDRVVVARRNAGSGPTRSYGSG